MLFCRKGKVLSFCQSLQRVFPILKQVGLGTQVIKENFKTARERKYYSDAFCIAQ